MHFRACSLLVQHAVNASTRKIQIHVLTRTHVLTKLKSLHDHVLTEKHMYFIFKNEQKIDLLDQTTFECTKNILMNKATLLLQSDPKIMGFARE